MDEFPTDKTAIMITAFMTLDRPSMLAFVIAITNGLACASDPEFPMRRGSV